MPLLSICVATLAARRKIRGRLLDCLCPQTRGVERVEVCIDEDDGEVSLGAKRQRMLERARGEYVAFIDDDDLVSPDYVERVLAGLEARPDCLGIVVKITKREQPLTGMPLAEHSLRHRALVEQAEHTGCRTPNHLNPMRREIALRVGYRDLRWAEDYDFGKRVLPELVTEVFLPGWVYHYDWWPGGRMKDEG